MRAPRPAFRSGPSTAPLSPSRTCSTSPAKSRAPARRCWPRRASLPRRTRRSVRRLRAGGAVIVAKTNMTEFAFSGIGANPHYGTPGNPADRKRVPGGSSSGAAVAAADGMCEIAIGTDTGGSTRIPAAFCGIVGFKPSRQRIPTDGAFPLSYSIDSDRPDGADGRSLRQGRRGDGGRRAGCRSSRRRSPICASASRRAWRWRISTTRSANAFPRASTLWKKPARGCRTRSCRCSTTWRGSTHKAACAGGGLRHPPRSAGAPRRRHRPERARAAGARAQHRAADYITMVRERARADPRHGCAARRSSTCWCLPTTPDRRADHGRGGHAGGLRAQERDAAAQHRRSSISSISARSRCRCRARAACPPG